MEVHRWLSRTDGPGVDHPDLLVVDLDPPERSELAALRATARAVRDLFALVGLTPYRRRLARLKDDPRAGMRGAAAPVGAARRALDTRTAQD